MDIVISTEKVVVIIPIYYPDVKFYKLLKMLQIQKDVVFDVYIVDSGSDVNDYKQYLTGLSYKIIKINPRDFNHGGTRKRASIACSEYPFLIYMTQDAILANECALKYLLDTFKDEQVGCAYGRQLPHKDANILAARARVFNYPAQSRVKQLSDAKKMGIKVSFISDTFAAYRTKTLQAIGGFPIDAIFGEDAYVGSKMILNGWKIAYCAEAQVYHSHNYTMRQEFKRYFDTGVFHSKESWILEAFGQAESEGLKFVVDELKYFLLHKPSIIPQVIIRDGFKFIGYQLGAHEKLLPAFLKTKFGMVPRNRRKY